jgi:acetyl esterase/lipase
MIVIFKENPLVYTVKKLAQLSGVSVRTLHYYDEIGLLRPAYHGANGYRYYETNELLRLQQILFFRELGFDLKEIEKILNRGDFDKVTALVSHRRVLEKDLEKTKRLIQTIDKTIEHLKGKTKMKDKEIFDGFIESYKLADPDESMAGETIEDLRNQVDLFAEYAGQSADISFSDRKVPVRDGFPLSIRIYNDQLPPTTPVLIFYPGCAFVFDLFEVNGTFCSRIAKHAEIKVILVQFRLAPEYSMPTSLYDGYDAASYIAEHSQLFGIDPKRIILGGWASGAHCSAVVSSLLRETKAFPVYHQILLSGTFDLTESTHEYDKSEIADKTLKRQLLRHIVKNYYGILPEEYKNPLFSPFYESNFNGLPPTTLLCGEYDAVRNDTEGYFQKLKKGGAPVEKRVLKGQSHNSIALRKILPNGSDPAIIISDIIKRNL